MKPTTPLKQVQHFIGVANYYPNMWPRRPHTLAPLTRITSNKRKFQRKKIEQDAFDEIKWTVARDNLLTYPYFNKTFKIHTNANAFQLGSVIIKKGKPFAFYSRNLTDAQQRYTETKRLLPSTVETLKDFWEILIG